MKFLFCLIMSIVAMIACKVSPLKTYKGYKALAKEFPPDIDVSSGMNSKHYTNRAGEKSKEYRLIAIIASLSWVVGLNGTISRMEFYNSLRTVVKAMIDDDGTTNSNIVENLLRDLKSQIVSIAKGYVTDDRLNFILDKV